ncbi:Protein prickle [Pseudolycoriella hygida]|uniref:Protein prickle n=1 Tax=Pseudolycoriella hygida TaxID=35572 RepID=A0A9Q0N4Y5_9DIPT|nr:Protein prickle [Pseudolycoriella hygida]
MSTATEGIPRTANLLACKQWWKVCFLYGDQEKYYRQIYGKAASQRLALSNQQCDTQSNVTDTTDDKKPTMSPTLFPLKQPSRRRSKMQPNHPSVNRGESIKPNSKVTVLDDPFLFGLNEHANLSEDSGIDNAAFEHPTTTVRRCATKLYSERELCNDLKINEDDLKNLHLSRNRSGLFHQINQSFSFSEVNVNEKVDDVKASDQNGLHQINDNYVAANE